MCYRARPVCASAPRLIFGSRSPGLTIDILSGRAEARLTTAATLQKPGQGFPCRLDHLHYRPAFIECGRRPIPPNCGWSVYLDSVPHNPAVIVLSHQVRYQAPLVPELASAGIGDPSERSRRGRRPVHQQHRLPDDERLYRLPRELAQHAASCRGPLQAHYSSG